MENKNITNSQHEENINWLSGLAFYKDDLRFLEGRLCEISKKYSDKSVLAQIEHYQNQFIIQRNKIDELIHLIKLDEHKINESIFGKKQNSEQHITDHSFEKEEYYLFKKIFIELRADYIRFLAKWL